MPAFSAYAPGKIILFGEHAVVYGQPAVAAPVSQVKARAVVSANLRGSPGSVRIQAPDVGEEAELASLPATHPIGLAVRSVLALLKVSAPPACTLKVTSTIPIAAGLGSGAAVSVAVLRAFSAYLGRPLKDAQVSELAFEVEKLHHGTPSGIDNTVITYGKPVYFIKGKPIEMLKVPVPFTIVIGDTGIASPTAAAVGEVRQAWKAKKSLYESYFESAGSLAASARQMIEHGIVETLGPLMSANHGILRKMGVSCLELDELVTAATKAGALGAKLSGGGRGGNMIALVAASKAERVAQALQRAGAANTIITVVGKSE
ncbi:MAG: mevalonate kinase [Anaerolineales bacterium]|jgi:mevalonate kinase|nr:mevalonate kinase [Anaerolineales bacterium]